MFPLKDDVPSTTFPAVNYLIIFLCTLAFLAQLVDQADGRDSLVERYGMVPARVLDPGEPVWVQETLRQESLFGPRLYQRERPMEEPPFSPALTLITSMFLHGGWFHFLGNMWFLYIFGDNVEERFGRLGYLVFYLLAGIGAGVFHLGTNVGSPIPTIGASGAIAGVMGAYFLLYPRARVLVLVPIFFILELMVLPAAIFLGLWFALQLFQGAFSITAMQTGGVAWWAHVGGFVFGVGAAFALARAGLLRRAPVPVRLHSRHFLRPGSGRGYHDRRI